MDNPADLFDEVKITNKSRLIWVPGSYYVEAWLDQVWYVAGFIGPDLLIAHAGSQENDQILNPALVRIPTADVCIIQQHRLADFLKRLGDPTYVNQEQKTSQEPTTPATSA